MSIIGKFFNIHNNNERHNIFWMLSMAAVVAAAQTTSSIELVQTFLLKSGLSKSQIGIFGSAGNIAFIAGTVIFMGMADNIRKRIRAIILSDLFSVLIPVTIVILSITVTLKLSAAVILGVLTAAAVIQNLIASLKNLLSFIITTRTVRLESLGRFSGIQGICASTASIAASLASIRILDMLGYPSGFTLCFAIAVILSLFGTMTYTGLKELPDQDRGSTTQNRPSYPLSAIFNVFKIKEFRILAAPNILRGMVLGITYFIMAVGINRLNIPVVYASYIITLNTVASLTAFIIFSLLYNKWGAGNLCFYGSILAAVSLAGIVLSGTHALFLVFSTFTTLGLGFLVQAVPMGFYEVVNRDIIGVVTGARFLLMQGGSALSMLASGWILDSFNPVPLFLLAAVLQIICGTLFKHGFKTLRKTRSDACP